MSWTERWEMFARGIVLSSVLTSGCTLTGYLGSKKDASAPSAAGQPQPPQTLPTFQGVPTSPLMAPPSSAYAGHDPRSGLRSTPTPGNAPRELFDPPPPPPGPAAFEHIALMSQQLHQVEDETKILRARLQQTTEQLEDKEQALAMAEQEILAARESIARSRAELLRWRQEMSALRDRLRSSEKENLATLEAIIKLLERLLEEKPPPPNEGNPSPSPP